MSAVATRTEITPKDLLRMPEEKDFELVDGELVERNMGAMSSWIGGQIARRLGDFAESNDLGWVWPADNGYQCFPDHPKRIRKPDASFVRYGRLPGNQLPNGYLQIAPDLVVEVISPNDLAVEVDGKVIDYLNAGVPLIWVVNPDSRVVHIHRADGSVARLKEADELSGEDVLPGFLCKVSAIFPPPAPADSPSSEDVPTA